MTAPLWCVVCLAAALTPAAQGAETFVLLDSRTGKMTVENARRARERFTPCSTFKIPNSLIQLDSGVAPDAFYTLEYDPKRDGPQQGAWARDLDLKAALQKSAAWYYRELARRLGPVRMQSYVDRFQYGNRDTSGGVDQFWIGRGLKISAEEQVSFLQRFYEGRLGISPRATSTVKELLLLETAPDYRWYGKTGTCSSAAGQAIAWHVGYVERNGKVTYYALNFDGGTVSELFARRPQLIRTKLSSAGLIASAQPSAREQMETRIQQAIAEFPGKVSLFATNLDTGQSFGIREDEPVRTASTIKLPIMTAVFSAVAQGKASWTETLELKPEEKVSGSGVLTELSGGLPMPLRDLVNLMIVVSDNTATNLILNRFPGDFVNGELSKLGLEKTRSLRKILGSGPPSGLSREGSREEFRRFGIGMSTPHEMVMLLEKLERGEVVSAAASKEMIDILRRQRFKEGIGRQLPDHWVASKSGALDRLRSDAGIVYSNAGRIAIAVTVDDMPRTDYSPDNAGNLVISKIAGFVLNGLAAPTSDLGSPGKVIELKAGMDHVQGIEVDGDRLWVTWVDRKNKTGHLGEFELSTGKLIRSVPVHNGERYHPGGMAGDGDWLWLPVAEYKPRSSAVIQKRSKKTLALETEFSVPDHIGCVAVDGDRVYGGNWDSLQMYTWDRDGRLVETRNNTSGTSFQDVKAQNGELIGAGLRPDGGSIDWLDAKTLRLNRRLFAGKTDRGVFSTHEGMAISGDWLYLLPEDGPSRLFVFKIAP
jgi:beta-lactamase class D